MRSKASWLVRSVMYTALMAGPTADASYTSYSSYSHQEYDKGWDAGARAKTEQLAEEEEKRYSRDTIGIFWLAVGVVVGGLGGLVMGGAIATGNNQGRQESEPPSEPPTDLPGPSPPPYMGTYR